MSKVTRKLQLTIPKRLAEALGIKSGDEVEWVQAGESLRILPAVRKPSAATPEERLRLFDKATDRIRRFQAGRALGKPKVRGWTREDLYVRGGSH